jgi:hypothetical protein
MIIDIQSPKFTVTDELKETLPNLLRLLNEFITINNEYVQVKALEDKTKAKKPKPNTSIDQSVKQDNFLDLD